MSTSTQRIRLLDILRGFAILGTLGTNIWVFAYLGDLNYIFTSNQQDWWLSWDTFLRTFWLSFITGKFLGLLAMLFGVGLEIKYRQAIRKGRPWPGTYLWVSIILMSEGLLHFILVMEYDILMGYAAASIAVAFIVKAGYKAIKRFLIILGSIHIVFVILIFAVTFMTYLSGDNSVIATPSEAIGLYQHGSWLEQVVYRLENFIKLRIEIFVTIALNICLLLIGLLLMRAGAFSPDEKGKALRKRLLKVGLYAGLPLNLLMFIPGGLFDFSIRYLFAPLLSLGYLSLIALALEKWSRLKLWDWFENIGKMSLSTYIAQNLISSIVFYGWGLGLGGKLNSAGVIGMWALLCAVQLLLATLWLKRFKLGPMEGMRKRVIGLLERPPKNSGDRPLNS